MGERYVCTHTRDCKLPFTSPRALARCLSSAAARLPQPPLEMVAQMDDKNRALCFFYRNPPNGAKRLTYAEIAEIVRNEDGGHPSEGAVRQCVMNFHEPKATRGRKSGYRKTTKAEDNVVLQTFRKLRPPGHGVDSRQVHTNLPKKLRDKLSRRTIIRRLAEQRYVPTKKAQKTDPGRSIECRLSCSLVAVRVRL